MYLEMSTSFKPAWIFMAAVRILLCQNVLEARKTHFDFRSHTNFLNLSRRLRIVDLAEDEYRSGHILVATRNSILSVSHLNGDTDQLTERSAFNRIYALVQVSSSKIYVADYGFCSVISVDRESNHRSLVFGNPCINVMTSSDSFRPRDIAYNPFNSFYYTINGSTILEHSGGKITDSIAGNQRYYFRKLIFDRSTRKLYLTAGTAILQIDFSSKTFVVITESLVSEIDFIDGLLIYDNETAVIVEPESNSVQALKIPSEKYYTVIDTITITSATLICFINKKSHLVVSNSMSQLFLVEIAQRDIIATTGLPFNLETSSALRITSNIPPESISTFSVYLLSTIGALVILLICSIGLIAVTFKKIRKIHL